VRKNLLFLKKKKQKDFYPVGGVCVADRTLMGKSFLVLFFKIELLSYTG
jgi:hypothetical protein